MSKKTLMEKLNEAIKIDKPLSDSLIKEYNAIRSMFPAAKRKKLDILMRAAGKRAGEFGQSLAAKRIIKETGGVKTQKKAKQGGNPNIQKKQGFVGAMAKGGKATKKAKGMAKGGKTMMKKSKGMARGGKMMKSKGMARGGKAKR